MNNLFLDTDIIVDLLGVRHPFYHSVANFIKLADIKKIKLVTASSTYPTIFYILTKNQPQIKDKVLAQFRTLRTITHTSDLTDNNIDQGLNSYFKDFEVSLQYYWALSCDCDVIITRNAKDFKASSLPVMSAEEYLSLLKS